MKNITLKIIISIVCCSLVIALFLSSSAISQSREVMLGEVRKELLYSSQKYANEFSTELKTQENVVDLISVMVSDAFTVEEYREDRKRFLALENRLNEIIRDTMKGVPQTQSLYLTFNPGTSGGNDEVWYLRNEDGDVYYMEADNTVEDWLVDNGDGRDAYYFDAVRNGKSWRGVEYDPYVGAYSVTYSRACRDRNGELVGVMGTDIFIDHIFDTVKNIQMEEGGYAFLTDGDLNYLAGSAAEQVFGQMKEKGILDPLAKDSIGISFVDGERYLSTYTETSNGWILALAQREATLLAPIEDMKRLLFSMAGIILIGVLAYTWYFSRKSLAPIVREFEMKDVIMMHQSRQAKLGEMVGNIAHQWKQPLNVMSISLSNLWDDFGRGELTEARLKAHIDGMRTYIRNMSGTVDDFADFLKPSREKELFRFSDAVDTALILMQESIKINRITVVKEADEDLTAYGFRNEFCHGIFNILNNARDAIMESNPEKREIRVRIYAGYAGKHPNDKTDIIDIENDGDPIPEEALPLLFDAYYTTKEEKGGTGIGLYLTKEIVESHMGGSIRLFNVEKGVCCRIILSEARAAAKTEGAAE
jgi:signal transduction histidine kinase